MPEATEPHRKLAAILSADAVGYSRLMRADEPATVETLNAYRELIEADACTECGLRR
jgi:class 3 adenylate cyclase